MRALAEFTAEFGMGAVFGFIVGMVVMFVRDFLREFGKHEDARSAEEVCAPPAQRRTLLVGRVVHEVKPPPDFKLPGPTKPGAPVA